MATFQSQYTGNEIEEAIGKALQMEETFTTEEKLKVDAIDSEFVQNINQIKTKTDQLLPSQSVYYVDATNGNDDNDGTQNAPFKTIMKAVGLCQYSCKVSTIIIASGTYNETVSLMNCNNYICFIVNDGVTLTGSFLVENCPSVYVSGGSGTPILTVNSFSVSRNTKVQFVPKLVVNTSGSYGVLVSENCDIYFYAEVTVNGGATTEAFEVRRNGTIGTRKVITINTANIGFYADGGVIRVDSASVSNVNTKLYKLRGGQILTGAGVDLT